MSSVTIVGPGRMGLALATALSQSDHLSGVTVFGRHPDPPEHPVFAAEEVRYAFGMEEIAGDCIAVFLAVPDAAVSEVAHQVAVQGAAPDGCAAFHLSGALPTDVLAPLHAAGYTVGTFHPWIVVGRSVPRADAFVDARVSVTASLEATRIARDVASSVGAQVLTVPAARRPMSDAAVAMMSAYLPVMLDVVVPLFEEAGIPTEEVLPALLPLWRSVLLEVERAGVAETLATVLERTDPEAVGVHLRVLEGEDRRLYTWLGRRALTRAVAGLNQDERSALLSHFEKAFGE